MIRLERSPANRHLRRPEGGRQPLLLNRLQIESMRPMPRPSAPRRGVALATVAGGAVTAALVLLPAAPSSAIPPGGAVSKSNGASVRLSSSSVKRGTFLRVSGRNWKSKGSRTSGRAVVTVKLNDRDILAVIPIRSKRFSGRVLIPRQVRPGRYTLRFLAAKPATSIESKTFRVR